MDFLDRFSIRGRLVFFFATLAALLAQVGSVEAASGELLDTASQLQAVVRRFRLA